MRNIKQLLMTVVVLLCSMVATAHDFEVDGIYYNISSDEAIVTYKGDSYSAYSNEYLGSVVIPESITCDGKSYSVTSIEDYAFYNCSGLTSVTIPNSVTAIGYWAFYNCTSLTSVTIPNSVTSIEDYAFYNCSGLTSVTIPNSVTAIGNRAFYNCTSLTSVTIPNSVTSIGERVFEYCSGLTSIEIPNSVTSIGGYAFSGTAWYNKQPDGVVYAGKVLYKYKGVVMPNGASIEVEEGTLGIADYAFPNCDSPISVTIGSSVTSIGERAFSYCNGLTSIVVKGGNAKYDSRENCNAIIETATNTLVVGCKNTIIPNSVTSIGNSVFSGCSGLTSIVIPNSVTSIGDYAFNYCRGLTSIVIPNSVISIGQGAFVDCSGLTSIVIPNSVTSIGDYVFNGCSGLTSVTIGSSVTSIGRCAFDGCSGLTSIVIPNSVTSIGDYAFNGCSGLTSVTIGSSVTSIGRYAFDGCSGLKTVINLSKLTFSKGSSNYGYVGYYADRVINAPNASIEGDFVFCKLDGGNTLKGYLGDATELVLPENYKGDNYAIGEYAFYACSGLTSVEIPNSVTSIGDYAFDGCSGLTSIVVKGGNAKYDSRENCNAIIETATNTLVVGCKNTIIPNSVTSIGERAFYNCSGLTSVTIGNSVTSIGEFAFHGCSGLKTVINFSKLTFSKGSSNYGYVAYYADKVINASNGFIEGDFVFTRPNGVNTLVAYFGNATELTLPAYCDGETYVIAEKIFYGCRGLTSVVIPNSVTSIGEYAFYGCSGLTSVVIPNSVTSIDNYAFYGSGLKSVHLPNVNNIGTYIFANCSNLTKVSLNCKRVDNFFDGNKNVSEIILGENVLGILDNAFSGCSGIRTIRCVNAIPPKVGTGNFTSSHYQNAVLYVPKGSLAAYHAADVWKDFWEIQEFDATGIDEVHADVPAFEITVGGILLTNAEGKTVAIYSTSGALVEKIDAYNGEEITLDKGVYIVRVGGKAVKVKL